MFDFFYFIPDFKLTVSEVTEDYIMLIVNYIPIPFAEFLF